jgi:hypothetical protein
MLSDELKHQRNDEVARIWKKSKLLNERIEEALPAGLKGTGKVPP